MFQQYIEWSFSLPRILYLLLQPVGDNLAPRAEILGSPSPAQSYLCEATDTSSIGVPKHQPTIEFVKNVTYHNALHQRVHQSCRILHEGQSQGNHQSNFYSGHRLGCWEQLNTTDYLEINLGYPRSVTHIGTAGMYTNLHIAFSHGKSSNSNILFLHCLHCLYRRIPSNMCVPIPCYSRSHKDKKIPSRRRDSADSPSLTQWYGVTSMRKLLKWLCLCLCFVSDGRKWRQNTQVCTTCAHIKRRRILAFLGHCLWGKL